MNPVFTSQTATTNTITAQVTTDFAAPNNIQIVRERQLQHRANRSSFIYSREHGDRRYHRDQCGQRFHADALYRCGGNASQRRGCDGREIRHRYVYFDSPVIGKTCSELP